MGFRVRGAGCRVNLLASEGTKTTVPSVASTPPKYLSTLGTAEEMSTLAKLMLPVV